MSAMTIDWGRKSPKNTLSQSFYRKSRCTSNRCHVRQTAGVVIASACDGSRESSVRKKRRPIPYRQSGDNDASRST
jgi:hypothetical protein